MHHGIILSASEHGAVRVRITVAADEAPLEPALRFRVEVHVGDESREAEVDVRGFAPVPQPRLRCTVAASPAGARGAPFLSFATAELVRAIMDAWAERGDAVTLEAVLEGVARRRDPMIEALASHHARLSPTP